MQIRRLTFADHDIEPGRRVHKRLDKMYYKVITFERDEDVEFPDAAAVNP